LETIPLVVDLDGTLILTDMLHESALSVLRDKPGKILGIPIWLIKGKAELKRSLALYASFEPASLPYNNELLGWLTQQHSAGRKIVLCTASDASIAVSIAGHLKIFDEVIASNGCVNLAGIKKAEALEERFGGSGFDYVGNSNADLSVWKKANHAVVVNASSELTAKVRNICKVVRVFPRSVNRFSVWRRVLRLHQWLKNLLLFVPLLAAHEIRNLQAWTSLTVAFFSFSLCASSVYVTNDLLDLEHDRIHPRKRNRPFASGQVPVWVGVILAPVLLLAGLVTGSFVVGTYINWLIFYFLVTCAYSWGLKRLVLIDCMTLALLYTLRIIAGAAAVGHALSFWLLAFSVFLFLSLAFLKRYAELGLQGSSGQESLHGRGYRIADAPLIQTMGIASGYASVLVLALYLNSEVVVKLYRAPEWMWGSVTVMLFWINWAWMQAHRGKMNDDPLVFAVKDRTSLVTGVLFALAIIIGAVGLPW